MTLILNGIIAILRSLAQTSKDRAVLQSAGVKWRKVFTFFMQNFAIVRLGVYPQCRVY